MDNAFSARVGSGIVLVFFLSGLTLLGCRHQTKRIDPSLTDSYRKALKEWTREARSYEGLDLQLLVAATYYSPSFGTAYVSEYAKTYGLGPSETRRMADAQEQTARRYHQFLIAAYVYETRLNDFEKPGSIWKVYLTVDQERVEPEEIIKTKYADPKTRHFFPYFTPWKSAYRVRFPKSGSGERTLRLDITGVAGSVAMVWNGVNID